ncbi:MAG: hypothetical protein V3W41_02700 [Planctomycetota bacterium]
MASGVRNTTFGHDSGNPSSIHFDTWTHGNNSTSGVICDCLDAVLEGYKNTVMTQTAGHMFMSTSCSHLANGDFRIRLIFMTLPGWEFAGNLGGKLKICP